MTQRSLNFSPERYTTSHSLMALINNVYAGCRAYQKRKGCQVAFKSRLWLIKAEEEGQKQRHPQRMNHTSSECSAWQGPTHDRPSSWPFTRRHFTPT